MQITEIASKILQNIPKHDTPVIIGLEGFGGSGKTTIAKQLNALLSNAYTIHIDDFIVKAKLAEPAWDTGVFDHDRLEAQVLRPAVVGDPVAYQKLLYSSNHLSKTIRIPNVEYLIIEGISCYVPRLAHYYDFKIWIDTPIQISKKRGQERDGTHGTANDWAAWALIDIRYQQKYHPELKADFTVSNN